MKVIVIISVIAFCAIDLSEQKSRLVGDCSNYTKDVEELKNQCLSVHCETYGVGQIECGYVSGDCGSYSSMAGAEQDDEATYPDCCPKPICKFDFGKAVTSIFTGK